MAARETPCPFAPRSTYSQYDLLRNSSNTGLVKNAAEPVLEKRFSAIVRAGDGSNRLVKEVAAEFNTGLLTPHYRLEHVENAETEHGVFDVTREVVAARNTSEPA